MMCVQCFPPDTTMQAKGASSLYSNAEDRLIMSSEFKKVQCSVVTLDLEETSMDSDTGRIRRCARQTRGGGGEAGKHFTQ